MLAPAGRRSAAIRPLRCHRPDATVEMGPASTSISRGFPPTALFSGEWLDQEPQIATSSCTRWSPPFGRTFLQQILQPHPPGLPPIEDRLDDVRRQQSEAQDPAHVAAVDTLALRDENAPVIGHLFANQAFQEVGRRLHPCSGAACRQTEQVGREARSEHRGGMRHRTIHEGL
jgi:hypothetical protein